MLVCLKNVYLIASFHVVFLAYDDKDNWYSVSVVAMITDIQLAAFANILGVSLFLLVVLYHFVAVNNPKRKEE